MTNLSELGRMRNPLLTVFHILNGAERRQLAMLALLSLLAATLETISVLAVVPFMTLVSDSAALDRLPLARGLQTLLSLNGRAAVLTAVGALTLLALALSAVVGIGNQWAQLKFAANTRVRVSTELFACYLHLPYSFHLHRDSASLMKVMVHDVDEGLVPSLTGALNLLTKCCLAIALLGTAMAMSPIAGLSAVAVLGTAYWLIFSFVRPRQSRAGRLWSLAQDDRIRTANEGFGGVKELQVLGRQAAPVPRYKNSLERIADAEVSNSIATALPKLALELVVFGGIVALTLWLVSTNRAAEAIPTLSLYAFAGYRLLPALQQVFAALTSLSYRSAALQNVRGDLESLRKSQTIAPTHSPTAAQTAETPEPAMRFERNIRLQDLHFRYENAGSRSAIDGLSLEICRNQSIGLVGKSGSGKTTLADLVLGLFAPSSGQIWIDSVPLSRNNIAAWRGMVGYVPQHVFLANATIAQNVAFGVDTKLIDTQAVKRALCISQAIDFVENLPQRLDTKVGERGVRLSGGQRQRLGIARALYHNPKVLIFDEATSALDGMTEDAVMEAIRRLSRERTVLLIAHRMRTVQTCDKIVFLDAGRIVAEGTHFELMANVPEFNRLAGGLPSAPDAHQPASK